MATIPVVTSQVVSVEVNGTTYEREVEARAGVVEERRDLGRDLRRRLAAVGEHRQLDRHGSSVRGAAGTAPTPDTVLRMTSVTICDVGPRDGLQNQPVTLEPAVRAELVDRLATTGLRRIEAVSFVNPERVPQMAGAEEVVAAVERRDGVVFAGLALNERGYERLRDTGLDEVHYSFAATDEFNRRNAGATVDEGVAAGLRIVERARADGIRATVTIGVAFGCPFEGAVDPGRVEALAARFAAAETDEILVADTVGVGVPRQARDLVERILPLGRPVGVRTSDARSRLQRQQRECVERGDLGVLRPRRVELFQGLRPATDPRPVVLRSRLAEECLRRADPEPFPLGRGSERLCPLDGLPPPLPVGQERTRGP